VSTVIVIMGPTASGKTQLAIELAKRYNGEIVSADSMQIYKYMDIGTAKPEPEEMQGIRHYLINEVEPDQEFSVARYQELAIGYIEEILAKGKTPVVVGGTGLYINSLVYNINFSESIIDWGLRDKLKQEAEEKGNQVLHDRLREIDPQAAERIHVNDTKRIIRALEVFEHTRQTISHHQEISRQTPSRYQFRLIGLTMEREKLYDRINRRVDLMLEKGLIEEVKKLVSMGYDKNTIAMQALGYKEILAHLRGDISLEEVVYIIKRDSRHYAKRQLTWFKRLESVHWIKTDDFTDSEAILKNIEVYIASDGIFL
jgi:tRNA dimethylallyltransferase